MMTVDKFGCLNNTIKVASGSYFDLVSPQPEMVDLESIAAALSKICRFGGHSPVFYSVAEHCVLATELASELGCDNDQLKAILLHDATEAYAGDVVKPLKILLPQYQEIEQRIEIAVQARFGVDFALHANVVKRFDRAMLKAEKLRLWPSDLEEWQGFSDIETHVVKFGYWQPIIAERKFLTMADMLGIE